MKYENFCSTVKISGTGALNATLAATAVVQVGPVHPDEGQVKFTTSAAHGFVVGSHVYIEGTTNYDGVYEIKAVPSTTTFQIQAKFIAETPAGTETVKFAIKPNAEFFFVGFSIHLSAAPTTSENFTIDLDADDGAAWDVNIYTRDFSSNSDTDIIWVIPEESRAPYEKADIIRFAWTNTDGRTYGIRTWWQRRS